MINDSIFFSTSGDTQVSYDACHRSQMPAGDRADDTCERSHQAAGHVVPDSRVSPAPPAAIGGMPAPPDLRADLVCIVFQVQSLKFFYLVRRYTAVVTGMSEAYGCGYKVQAILRYNNEGLPGLQSQNPPLSTFLILFTSAHGPASHLLVYRTSWVFL